MRESIVAIVGRPNVGKSTLFNRIIRRKEAIVDNQPGVTRDRKYAHAEWEGVNFTLVDTGGYIPKTRDIIEEGVTAQVRAAILEADLILFVVDATTGITDVDGEVADILRKSDKPYILAANKADNPARELEATTLYKLGLGDLMLISALGGRGIGDLLSALIEKLDPIEDGADKDASEDVIKVAIIGRPNAGKSTYINTILGEERLLVTEIPGTTRDSVDVRLRFKGQNIELIDTAGLRRRTKVHENVEFYSTLRTKRAVEECDVACVFVDASEGLAQQDMRVIQDVLDKRKGILLVVNKWDLIEDDPDALWIYEDNLEQKMRGIQYIPVMHVSCKTGLRIRRVLHTAVQIAAERSKRIPSASLNKLIQDLGRRYQPPTVKGKRVRLLYATQVGEQPPLFAIFSNHPDLLKDTTKRFLENQIRAEFGFQGVPISLIFRKK
ncbi:ribosome biogenesis GTPase Der [candidate division KSB1 bacterium]|nr:ribosome biogenesis GTPase Der [candidate division KSB1 bacterium]